MTEFKEELENGLYAKLHSRKIGFELFVYSDDSATLNIYANGMCIKLTINFSIRTIGDKVYVYHKDKEYFASTVGSAISIISSIFRKYENKISKF